MSSKSYPDEIEEDRAYQTAIGTSVTESASMDNGVTNTPLFYSAFTAGMLRAMQRDSGLEVLILANPERYTENDFDELVVADAEMVEDADADANAAFPVLNPISAASTPSKRPLAAGTGTEEDEDVTPKTEQKMDKRRRVDVEYEDVAVINKNIDEDPPGGANYPLPVEQRDVARDVSGDVDGW
ncbi:hypothetical protein B484DRAFT_466445 [Ochromonadaceae sp. CCMP2298]|nr:hypothetical protein B484DRAFT_466445 [Ochromonadaceae sp. CCMP2298]